MNMIPKPELATDVHLDREQAFLLYATFCGDVEKTAHALNIRPIDVLRVADDEGWNDKLKSIIELKKSGRPGDIERAINRALNFVMAHKFRLFLERVLHRITGMDAVEFEQYLLTHESKEGEFKRLSTRALADLASAMEKAQAMSYMALNDSAPERAKRKAVEDDAGAGGELHIRIAEAMSQIRESRSPRAALLDAQLNLSQQIAIKAAVAAPKVAPDAPVNPYDKD
jgi:hypothetical protein